MFTTTVIIPTYNRPKELNDCLRSILTQTVKPQQLIVVDDGNLPAKPLETEFRAQGVDYLYLKKDVPGLTESRNAGIARATGEIIFFFDDDTVLLPDYIEEILRVYHERADEDIGGVGGVAANPKPVTLGRWIRRIFDICFLVAGVREGRVLPSGFCTDVDGEWFCLTKTSEVDFLAGCMCSYKREVFNEFRFTDRYRRYGFGEDKDFSYRVSKRHKLYCAPKARLYHYESTVMRPNKPDSGRMLIVGRYMFFRDHVKKGWWSWIFFYYALFGYIMARLAIALVTFDRSELGRLRGMFGAVKDIIAGRIKTE